MLFEPVPAYHFLSDKPLGSYRFRGVHGGRGSAKSWEAANAALFHAVTNPALRIVFLREIMASLKESSQELVRSRLKYYGLLDSYFIEKDGAFFGRHGQKIMFTGLWKGGKPEGIKSLEGAGLTIGEEAQEFKQESIDVLMPTILRTPHSEFWPFWNPNLPTDPIDKFFRGDIKPKKAIIKKINFDKNPHFPDALRELMALDYEKSILRAKWIWEGEYRPSVENSLWSQEGLDAAWRKGQVIMANPEFRRVVVGVDPSGGGDDVGIVTTAKLHEGAIILEDATCPAQSPMYWATQVAMQVQKYGADCVVVERNFGGDMVESTLRAAGVSVRIVQVTASRGKHIRAEPVAALYDQGLISHADNFAELNSEMLQTSPQGYLGEKSPNRLDAAVWAITELCVQEEMPVAVVGTYRSN